MSDDKKKYTLVSMDENVEKEPEFYYSREHRLSRASPRVRELNSKTSKMSVAKRIFGSRGNLMTFVLIIITCLMLTFVSKYSRAATELKFGGNTVTTTILKEGDALIMDITKQGPKTGAAYSGEVEIAVSPVISKSSVGETPLVFYHRVYFTQAGYDNFQISLPFDNVEKEFILLLRTTNEQKSVKLRVKQ